jgi:hypothetical protein
MLRNRFLILLGGCFLAASAAWADDVGYIDCSNHPEETQVFGKARKTPEVVASLPCGERFTILVYGFVFSRIETRDGKLGYVFSNLIAVDRSATSVQPAASVQLAAAKTKVPSTRATVAQPNPPAPAQPQPTPAQPAPATVSAPASPAPISSAPASAVPETTVTVAQPNPSAPAQPEPVPAQPAPIPAPGPASPAPISNPPETAATVVQPNPPAPAQPEPSRAEPAAPAIRPASARTSWERPNAPGVRRAPVLELFGGYAFARLAGGGPGSNVNGAMGSFGWNAKPWLQIVADTSYNVVTVSGTKNVLYGNHYGPRFFRRGRNRWGVTPFAEALVGGSRADTTVSGTGGYTTSENTFSIKAGGGLDIHPSRHIDIRLFDVDYYRTSFGTNVHQNNYWASTGIVIRLFGGGSE